MYSSTRKLLFQQMIRKIDRYSFPITDCYSTCFVFWLLVGEMSLMKDDTFSFINTSSMQFEMKWGTVRGVSQPLADTEDLTFSIMQPLASILTDFNQSFSTCHSSL